MKMWLICLLSLITTLATRASTANRNVKIVTSTVYSKTDAELISTHRHRVHVLIGHPTPHHNIRTPFATVFTLSTDTHGLVVTAKADALTSKQAPPKENGYAGHAARLLHLHHHMKLGQQSAELVVEAAHALLLGDRRGMGRWERGRVVAAGEVGFEVRVFGVGGVLLYECGCGSGVPCQLSTISDTIQQCNVGFT